MISFARNFSNKCRNQLLHTGLDLLKTAFEKVNHKATEATDEFIGNKIADKIVKTKPVNNEYSRNVEEIIIQPDKTRRNIKRIKTSTIKVEHKNKISKLLNDSTYRNLWQKIELK